MNLLQATACLALLVTGAAATPLPSSSLIVNGGFEAGNFTGWSLAGNAAFTSVISQPYDGFTPHGGNAYALLGPVGADGLLSQSFADTVGQPLSIDFWMASDGQHPNDFAARYDGTQLASLTDQPVAGWTDYRALVTGTGIDTLQFSFRNDPGYLALDDVSVSPIPEPATWGLLALALGTLAGVQHGRKRFFLKKEAKTFATKHACRPSPDAN